MHRFQILNSNGIKFLAAALMLIDHVGCFLLTECTLLRIIGRLSFPLFAFMFAEGCRHTRNKKKHFLLLLFAAAVTETLNFLFISHLSGTSIFTTFVLSALAIYALQYCKGVCMSGERPAWHKALAVLLFAFTVAAIFAFCQIISVDYGFWGCMLPVFAALPDGISLSPPGQSHPSDILLLKIGCLGVGLLILSLFSGSSIQIFSIFSVFLLLLYNGKRGKRNTKYFFYIFYPAHLLLLEGISHVIL